MNRLLQAVPMTLLAGNTILWMRQLYRERLDKENYSVVYTHIGEDDDFDMAYDKVQRISFQTSDDRKKWLKEKENDVDFFQREIYTKRPGKFFSE